MEPGERIIHGVIFPKELVEIYDIIDDNLEEKEANRLKALIFNYESVSSFQAYNLGKKDWMKWFTKGHWRWMFSEQRKQSKRDGYVMPLKRWDD